MCEVDEKAYQIFRDLAYLVKQLGVKAQQLNKCLQLVKYPWRSPKDSLLSN